MLVRKRLEQLLQEKDAPIFSLVSQHALQQLLQGEYAWPWYGQLMNIPQTIAYMLQIDFWLRSFNIQIVGSC
jgi:asparagine synthase (glutamine-hydrolysing)